MRNEKLVEIYFREIIKNKVLFIEKEKLIHPMLSFTINTFQELPKYCLRFNDAESLLVPFLFI